jgi:hypothetical protein
MDRASGTILALKPVTSRYKEELDPDGVLPFGLVAEEMEKVNRDLVVKGEDGKVMTIRYEAVNAMSLNEFLKEHRRGEELDGKTHDLPVHAPKRCFLCARVQTNCRQLLHSAKASLPINTLSRGWQRRFAHLEHDPFAAYRRFDHALPQGWRIAAICCWVKPRPNWFATATAYN